MAAAAAPAASVSIWNLRRVGQGFDAVALGIGGLLHVGFEFALFAQDFLLLQFDLLLLLDDADLDFLGLDQLAGLELLQVVRQVGFGFLLVHRRLVLRRRSLVVALRFGDFGVGGEFRFLAGLLACEDLIIASRSASAWAICASRLTWAMRGLPSASR